MLPRKLEQSACHVGMRVRIRRGNLLNSHCKVVLRVVRHDNHTSQVLSRATDVREGLGSEPVDLARSALSHSADFVSSSAVAIEREQPLPAVRE